MRLSHLLLPTEREAPADAEAVSHKLLVRAGLVRQVGAGLWTWLPAGHRVIQRVERIVREEMDAIGGQEMLMPTLTPAELWQRSGRYDAIGPELFRLQDRKGADLVLGLSHEETVTFHVASMVRSYRDLPLQLYHLQNKGRDEARPRAGVLRTREFVMKDAYSFDRDEEGLAASYEAYHGAYTRIMERCGLEFYPCEADVGAMGGSGAHEFMAPCAAGENDVVLAPGYAANVEVAVADPRPVAPLRDELAGELHTPGATTIAAVGELLGIEAGQSLKAFPVVVEGRELVLVLLRGDHRVNEVKLATQLGAGFRPAREDELPGPAGYIGPREGVEVLYDAAVAPGRYVAGANRVDVHVVVDVEAGERRDIRLVEEGDTIGGTPVRIEPAIEVGNIFKLGTRYSEPLGATFLDEGGRERPIVMGSYGIGPARIAAAAVEQHADERGISWPKAIAPFQAHLVALGKPGSDERAAADRVYDELLEAGIDVLYDDRDASTGEKLTDAELLGVPLRLTLGRRGLADGRLEAQRRRGREDVDGGVALEGAAGAVAELWRELP